MFIRQIPRVHFGERPDKPIHSLLDNLNARSRPRVSLGNKSIPTKKIGQLWGGEAHHRYDVSR